MNKLTLCCALLVLTTASSALAAEARIPISGTTTITTPGTYFLSRGLTGAGPLITVQADDVVIDLNGFTLTPTSGAGVFASNFDRVTVRNGFIVGGQSAVRLEGVEGARVERIATSGSTGAAIHTIDTTGLVVHDTILRNPGGEGVLVNASGLIKPAQIDISSNQIVGTGGTGISLKKVGGSIVSGNTINLVTGRGVLLDGSRGVQVTGNAIRETSMAGIALVASNGCQIADNVIRLAATDGLILDIDSTDNTITSNQATESGANGLQVGGDRNVLTSNLLGGNVGWGLYFNSNSQDNVFRTNVARGNSGGACAGGSTSFCNIGANNTSGADNFAPNLL